MIQPRGRRILSFISRPRRDGSTVIHPVGFPAVERPLSAHQPTNALSSVYAAAKTSRVSESRADLGGAVRCARHRRASSSYNSVAVTSSHPLAGNRAPETSRTRYHDE